MIEHQNRDLQQQNIQLKHVLSNVSQISGVKEMVELFEIFVLQLRMLLLDDGVQIVSIIAFKEGFVLDTEPYFT